MIDLNKLQFCHRIEFLRDKTTSTSFMSQNKLITNFLHLYATNDYKLVKNLLKV